MAGYADGGRGYQSGWAALAVGGAMTVGGALTVTGAATLSTGLTMGSGAQILAWVGAVGSPGYSFVGDTDTGLYEISADLWSLAGGGVASHYGSASQSVANVSFVASGSAYFYAPVGIIETAAPSALANFSFLYSLDVASKTALKALAGTAGTSSAANTIAGYIALDP